MTCFPGRETRRGLWAHTGGEGFRGTRAPAENLRAPAFSCDLFIDSDMVVIQDFGIRAAWWDLVFVISL